MSTHACQNLWKFKNRAELEKRNFQNKKNIFSNWTVYKYFSNEFNVSTVQKLSE